jgi:hypothetical protein
MNKKTQDYLAGARAWIEKNEDSDLDTKPVSQALDAADRAVREVEELREKLAIANGEQRVTFLVLQETLKSAKHARKARDARDKADKKASKAKVKPKATRAAKQ